MFCFQSSPFLYSEYLFLFLENLKINVGVLIKNIKSCHIHIRMLIQNTLEMEMEMVPYLILVLGQRHHDFKFHRQLNKLKFKFKLNKFKFIHISKLPHI